MTERAPDWRRARAHSLSVAPVVATSSTRIIVLPLTASGFAQAKAFFTFSRRAWRSEISVCGLVFLILFKTSARIGRTRDWAIVLATSSAWLYVLLGRRFLCQGPGAMICPAFF